MGISRRIVLSGLWGTVAAGPLASIAARDGFAATPVGRVETLQGQVEAQAPQAARRPLSRGAPVLLGDQVVTGDNASAVLRLDDGTQFDLGPETEITIDEYVYAPASRGSSLAASLLVGSLRFVSGAIAKTSDTAMEIETPIGTIGVRGTQAIAEVSGATGAESGTFALLEGEDDLPTAITVTNAQGTTLLDEPETSTEVQGRNGRPGAARRLSNERLQQLFQRGRFAERIAAFRAARLERIRQIQANLTPAQREQRQREIAERRRRFQEFVRDPANRERLRERFRERQQQRQQRQRQYQRQRERRQQQQP